MQMPLGEFEHHVLLAVLRLDGQAYGVAIRAELATCTRREPSPGALYTTLDRLEDKGLVRSRMGDSTPERGGRAKRYYMVSPDGVRALRAAHTALNNLWSGLTVFGDSHA